jgi:hypothetical protein
VNKRRPIKAGELQSHAWVLRSLNDARAVHQTVFATSGFISDTHDRSLDPGFVASRLVLIFLWGPTMHQEPVASVKRLAVLAGGRELEQELKQEALRHIRLAMQDFITLGSGPVEEPCALVGQPDVDDKVKGACRRFIKRLRQKFGDAPMGARFGITSFPHDFGDDDDEVVVFFDTDPEEAAHDASRCEPE